MGSHGALDPLLGALDDGVAIQFLVNHQDTAGVAAPLCLEQLKRQYTCQSKQASHTSSGNWERLRALSNDYVQGISQECRKK